MVEKERATDLGDICAKVLQTSTWEEWRQRYHPHLETSRKVKAILIPIPPDTYNSVRDALKNLDGDTTDVSIERINEELSQHGIKARLQSGSLDERSVSVYFFRTFRLFI